MYKSNYYTKEQMTKYKIQEDVNKTWLHTLQFFTKLFTQKKAYGDDSAANSGFDSAVHINDIPSNHSLVSTANDFTTPKLYIESLKEPFVAAWEYVAKECAPTLDKPDPADPLRTGLDTHRKQFHLIMKQISALLAVMAKGIGGGGGGSGGGSGGSGGNGGGGSGGGGSNRRRDQGTKVMFPNCIKLVVHTAADCFMLPANKDKIPMGTSPPNWIDRDRGSSIISILTIG